MKKYQFFLVFSVFFCIQKVFSVNFEPVLKCDQGKLRGTLLKTRNGKDIFAYMSIPFAQPPIGNLRFMPPVPFKNWNETLDATKIHPICPQRDIYRRSEHFEGTEDCLYLNVYGPKKHHGNKSQLLPVMVFFHGGGWLCGGGNSYWYGPDLLLDKNIILVVPNYRLGALGFLSTGDKIVPGNNGLKDQNLALKWIQKNIKYFGGDPKSVTIFGESAGGASVHYHMLSPISKDLFHKGIAMSGTSLSIWAFAPKNEAAENAKKLAKSLGCSVESSEKMIKCLQTIDAMDIVKQDVVFMDWDFDPMIPFKPTKEPQNVDGAFLTEEPTEIIKSGRIDAIPLITGITADDGALRAAGILNDECLLNELNRKFNKLIPMSLMYEKTAKNISKVTKDIKKFYFNDQIINWSMKKPFVDMYTDAWFLSGADRTVLLHLNYTKNPVYYYLFAYRGSSSFTKIFGGGEFDYGVCHADDLQYLFPVADGLFPDKKPSNEDKYVAELFTTLFTNFARTGDPTPEISGVITEKWKPVSDKMEYYQIEENAKLKLGGLFSERAKFWRDLEYNSRENVIFHKTNDEL